MNALPAELQATIISYLDDGGLRSLTNTCRSFRAWSCLCWRRLRLVGKPKSINERLEALDELLGDPDGPESLCLSRALSRAPNVRTLVIELGILTGLSPFANTHDALWRLRALRVLSLAHFHEPRSAEEGHTRLLLSSASRTLTDVVLHDCQHLDFHALLENQPALRTVDIDDTRSRGSTVRTGLAESWNSIESICTYLSDSAWEHTEQWVNVVTHSLNNNGLRNLRTLSIDKPMDTTVIALNLLPALTPVPLERLRLMTHDEDGMLMEMFQPGLLDILFTSLPDLTVLCLDHCEPFLRGGSHFPPVTSFAWPFAWDAWAPVFAKATRLETFIATVVSVPVSAPKAYSHAGNRRLHTGWGFAAGAALRTRTREIFATCPALHTMLWLAPCGMPDFAVTKARDGRGRVKYEEHSGFKLMMEERFWVPPPERDVETSRHGWNATEPRVHANQIFGWFPKRGPNQRDGLLERIWDVDIGDWPPPKKKGRGTEGLAKRGARKTTR